jgi:hypothetical protein
MHRTTKIGVSIAAGVSAVVAAAAIAVAAPRADADDSTPSPSSTSAPQGSDQRGDRPQETPLTGAAAEDATEAALAAVPDGTIIRVETDADGGGAYEAHVRKADGTEVVVIMDSEFKVTGVEAFAGRGGRGGHDGDGDATHQGRGGHDGDKDGDAQSRGDGDRDGDGRGHGGRGDRDGDGPSDDADSGSSATPSGSGTA